MRLWSSLIAVIGLGCTAAPTDQPEGSCGYPDATEPMALGEPLYPYAWPSALHSDGRATRLDLVSVHCADAADVDWSVHDLLVFVSVPAW